jgi:regulator of nonsense transcripts 1
MNKKRMAFFVFPNEDNIRLVAGDELKLLYENSDGQVKWKSRGHIVRIVNEEIQLELKDGKGAPIEKDLKFTVEFVWKSTSFERMRLSLKIFMRDE